MLQHIIFLNLAVHHDFTMLTLNNVNRKSIKFISYLAIWIYVPLRSA